MNSALEDADSMACWKSSCVRRRAALRMERILGHCRTGGCCTANTRRTIISPLPKIWRCRSIIARAVQFLQRRQASAHSRKEWRVSLQIPKFWKKACESRAALKLAANFRARERNSEGRLRCSVADAIYRQRDFFFDRAELAVILPLCKRTSN